MPEKNTDCKCSVQHYHGTTQCYRTCKCRRQECKDVNAADVRELRRRKAYGRDTTRMIDSGPVRRHVKRLGQRGWGSRVLSRETGVGETTIDRLLYENVLTVQAGTAEKLLALNPKTKRAKRDGTSLETVSAIGSHRRLQALVTLGFSLKWLAEYSGYGENYFRNVLARERILAINAQGITMLYERLWDKKPLPETYAQRQSVTMAKKHAKKNGWLPPMAWDDDRIDDPKYRSVA